MPYISPLGKVTISGTIGVTNEDTSLVGDSAWIAIDGTERRLDTTSLAAVNGYPMDLELEAQNSPCYIKQGDSTVTLPAIKARITADGWRRVTVSGIEQAYFATQRESGTTSGTLVATRLDVL